MASQMTAHQILDREFLEIRCKILEMAAALDRLERADGSVQDDPRFQRLVEALDALQEDSEDRAERVQMIFSRVYTAEWREQFGLAKTATVKPR